MSDPPEGLRPEALNAFWGWWAAAKDHVAAAIGGGTLGTSPLVGYITTAVHNLHPDLAWELGPGRVPNHNLTLTSEGNLALRRITEHWVRSAPAPDGTWEYYPSRQRTEPRRAKPRHGILRIASPTTRSGAPPIAGSIPCSRSGMGRITPHAALTETVRSV